MEPATTQRAAEVVKAGERAGWGEKAESYGLLTGRITARLVEPLLDAAGVTAGRHLLDVGTGPGYAAQRAAERGAIVRGVDIAEEMVALARRRNGAIEFLRADAEDLPFPEHSFDALVGNCVINHLPRPERATREFARVLTPAGEIALSTWDLPERNRFLGILLDALRACGIGDRQELAPGLDPFPFANDDEFRGLLRGAGFEHVDVRAVSVTHWVADANELWQGVLGGSVRTAGLVMRQPPRIRGEIRATVEQLAEQYRGDGGLAIPARAKIACGRRP
jgi:SAM-dependent methyltransferase